MSDPHTHVNCQQALDQLWDFLDQELTEDRMLAIRQHLEHCHCCHPHAEFAGQFLAALRRCKCKDPMPETLRSRVLETLKGQGLI